MRRRPDDIYVCPDREAPSDACAREHCGCSKAAHDIREGRCPWLLSTYLAPDAR